MTFQFRKLVTRLLTATCLALPLAVAIAPTAHSAPLSSALSPIPQRVLNLYANAAQMCGPITGGARNPVIERRIQDFNRVMNLSPTGRDLVNTAARYDKNPAWMCFENIKGIHAVYYIGKGVITVGLSKTNDEIVADTTHELRHLFQEKARDHSLKPQNNADRAHMEYIDEADAEATAALVLWELKQAGHAGPWNTHNKSENYGPRSICYAHITTAFRQAMENGATAPAATQAAFREWYRDKSLLHYYKPQPRIGTGNEKNQHGEMNFQQRAVSASACTLRDTAQPGRDYEIPSDYISNELSRSTGQLPAYNINYIQQGGGLRHILSGP